MNSLPSVPSRLPRSLVGCLLSVLAVTIVHSQTTAPVEEDADDTVLNLPTFEVNRPRAARTQASATASRSSSASDVPSPVVPQTKAPETRSRSR